MMTNTKKTLHIFYNTHGASLSMVGPNLQCIVCGKFYDNLNKDFETAYIIDGSGTLLCNVKNEEKQNDK